MTALRENEDRFPFKPVLLIRAGNRRGSLAWFHGQFNRRLGWPRRPANVWKASLRSLSTTQDLFHAHFGPAAYRRLFRKGAAVAEGSAMRERLIALGSPVSTIES